MYIYGGNNISDAIPARLFRSSVFPPTDQTHGCWVDWRAQIRHLAPPEQPITAPRVAVPKEDAIIPPV